MDKPTKPGWYYAKLGGQEVVIEYDNESHVRTGNSILRADNPVIHWLEPVPTLAELQQLRAERDTLKKQVEFLEWMATMVNLERVAWVTFYLNGEKNITVCNYSARQEIMSWPGELRDGWPHLDAIKEAVK